MFVKLWLLFCDIIIGDNQTSSNLCKALTILFTVNFVTTLPQHYQILVQITRRNMPHGHGHCHDHHDHDHGTPDEVGIHYNLFERIDTENLQCLNEAIEGSGKTVFKSWEERFDTTKFVESDADEELLFNIPFTGNVKLKGIKIISEDTDSHPAKLKLFKNKPNMTFDDVSINPDQVFELQRDGEGVIEYYPKIVSFSSVSHLTMHFPCNYGAENTKIYYIGFKGEWSPGHRHGVTICTYEARPNLTDHTLRHLESASKPVD